MSFNKIRLELARDQDFPDGSRERGYEFTAPLSDNGRISENETGRPIAPAAACAASGVEGLMRSVHYDLLGDPDDDEAGYRFANHRFRPRRMFSGELDDVGAALV